MPYTVYDPHMPYESYIKCNTNGHDNAYDF